MERFTKFRFSTCLLIATSVVVFGCSQCSNPELETSKIDKTLMMSEPSIELKTSMRKLWDEHVIWTRNAILCLVDELPGTDQAVKRLLQNQVDIGNSFKPFYGEAFGNKLTVLLKAHINISADVVKAAKIGSTTAFDEVNKRWYANADDISEFLCRANSDWKLTDMKMMMRTHLKITTDEAEQRIKKNYDADIIAFDKIHNEILIMADVFSDGIMKQFPEKLKTSCNSKEVK